MLSPVSRILTLTWAVFGCFACGYTNTTTPAAAGAPATPVPGAPGGGGGTTTSQAATYTQASQQIFQPLCVSCHSAGGQSPNLSSYAGFATSSQYVVPGNPSQSLIYTITQSGQMPPNGNALTAQQQALLGSWIQGGAKNN